VFFNEVNYANQSILFLALLSWMRTVSNAQRRALLNIFGTRDSIVALAIADSR